MVTAHPDSSDQGKLGLEGEPGKRSHDWLLKHLPALPVFPFVMAQMCETLRQVGAVTFALSLFCEEVML